MMIEPSDTDLAASPENAQAKLATLRASIPGLLAAEREKCAVIAETFGVRPSTNMYNGGPEWFKHARNIAAAIRELGDQK